MNRNRTLFNSLMILVLLLGLFSGQSLPLLPEGQVVQAAQAAQPVVAIHVSELTQALEDMPAVPPTPTGTTYSGKQWFYTSWHYFVMYESLKISLESDGTPYVVVTDADIAAGILMDGSRPKYPIVISLAAEAVADNEVQPLRDYVNAGGFLFVGSSSYTRRPDGTSRGNFALSEEMGLKSSTSGLENWIIASAFTHLTDHRLVSHIPVGTVNWDMLLNAEDIVWGSYGAQHIWGVTAIGAEVIATTGGVPLLATRGYGDGRFIYYGPLNPLVGAGGPDTGMYAYTIFRSAIEWAFEAANLPLTRRSPWPYAYDSAFIVRHDFENSVGSVAAIESSAQYEATVGAKGDYYFCTGILRTMTPEARQPYVDSLRRAVSLYGATIGPHNGGYFNPSITDPNAYDYWHWGPDTMLDRTDFTPDYPSYTSGYEFSKDSIRIAYEDIENWLAGTDNGRAGCGAAGNCPRTWVSPYFNSGRDRSFQMMEELGTKTMGEQKVSPFPHWTLSYNPANTDHRYAILALPPSDWFVGSSISQSIEGHNTQSIHALVDFYYQKGYLMNLYGHGASNGGVEKTYIDHALTKPRVWSTNAVGLYDWWVKRDPMVVTPSFTRNGTTAVLTAAVSGATDPEAAVELALPFWTSGIVGNVQVKLNGAPANASQFRATSYGVKVKVGTTVNSIEVTYTPLDTWTQTTWSGGAGQSLWSDPTRYESTGGIVDSQYGQISLPVASAGAPMFGDDFSRSPVVLPDPVPFTWNTTVPGNAAIFNTLGGALNTSTTLQQQYGYAYKELSQQPVGDYTIDVDIRFPVTGSFGGGIAGRLNPTTGQRYGVWVYPGAAAHLTLLNFSDWTAWSPVAGLANVAIPNPGTEWHHLRMVFSGSNIQVFYDDMTTPKYNATDTTYSAGHVDVDFWTSGNTAGPSYNNYVVTDPLGNVIFQDNFGDDAAPVNLFPDWTTTGTWTLVDNAARATQLGSDGYAHLYSNAGSEWTDYTLQGRVRFESGAFGGGLVGRLDATTGKRYTAWVYAGSSKLNLLKWSNWSTWGSLMEVPIPAVGTGWHDLKMTFSGNRILVFWDGSLAMDVVDQTMANLTGRVGADAYQQGATSLIDLDDITVSGVPQYQSSGSLLSSAFDGGVGAQWYTLSWDGVTPASTSACIRTRSAQRADQLPSAAWSSCYPAGIQSLAGITDRWLQYKVELSTSNTNFTPVFSESRVTFAPGNYLPGTLLANVQPSGGESLAAVTLRATLTDEGGSPIAGRMVRFTLDGLPVMTATTDAGGVAETTRSLDLAPGTYTLAVAFNGDSAYAPTSASAPFNVTENWLEWNIDSAADFAAGTTTGVDLTTLPGSVVLSRQIYGEGEETGPFTLEGGTWAYRRKISIDNPNASALPAGYTLKVTADTAALVSAGKALASGDDIRVVWTGGSSPLDLDRVADSAFNSGATVLWFKTQASMAAGASDTSYFLYYGNPAAGAPKANPAGVWSLYDGFDDITIDGALWTQGGTVTESDGWARLTAGSNLFSRKNFVYGTLEARIQAVLEDNYMWWGFEDGVADAANFMVFEEYPPTTNLAALLRNDGAAFQTLAVPQPAGNLTSAHTYTLAWRQGRPAWFIDGVEVASSVTGIPDTAMSVILNASSVAYNVDWIRVRAQAALDPVVALASTYEGYSAQGTFTSAPKDLGGSAALKWLVWDAVKPNGAGLSVSVRGAATQAALESAPWTDFSEPGLLTGSPAARWVQIRAALSTTDPSITPELHKITLYYAAPSTNAAPVAAADSYETGKDLALVVPAPGVLGNDTDADGDTLTASVATGPSHGTLALNANGGFTYTPTPGYTGLDSFTYTASDGTATSSAATVSIEVKGSVVPPVLPSVFTGQLIYNAPAVPPAGKSIVAYVSGLAEPVAVVAITEQPDGMLTYIIDVPGDLPDTPAKEGGVEGDTVTFEIDGRVAAKGVWHSGSRVQLDIHGARLNLQAGWNLISLPLKPAGVTPAEVLESVADQYDLVYAWDAAAQGWMSYAPDPQWGGTLTSIDENMGFWVKVTAPAGVDLDVAGQAPSGAAVAVVADWNLVGYPALAAGPVPAGYGLVYSFRPSLADPWLLFDRNAAPWANDLTEMAPTWGYWVKPTQ